MIGTASNVLSAMLKAMAVIVGRAGARHGKARASFPLPFGRGDSACAGFVNAPKVLRPNRAVHFPSRGYFSFKARPSQSCGNFGVCIRAKYPTARQSKLVAVSEINH